MSKFYFQMISIAVILEEKDEFLKEYKLLKTKPDKIISITYEELLTRLNEETEINELYIEKYNSFYNDFLIAEDKRLNPEKYIFRKIISTNSK